MARRRNVCGVQCTHGHRDAVPASRPGVRCGKLRGGRRSHLACVRRRSLAPGRAHRRPRCRNRVRCGTDVHRRRGTSVCCSRPPISRLTSRRVSWSRNTCPTSSGAAVRVRPGPIPVARGLSVAHSECSAGLRAQVACTKGRIGSADSARVADPRATTRLRSAMSYACESPSFEFR